MRRLVRDLDLPTSRSSSCPTVREPDGLALSSRNVRLDADERRRAVALYAACGPPEGRGRGERDAAAIEGAGARRPWTASSRSTSRSSTPTAFSR